MHDTWYAVSSHKMQHFTSRITLLRPRALYTTYNMYSTAWHPSSAQSMTTRGRGVACSMCSVPWTCRQVPAVRLRQHARHSAQPPVAASRDYRSDDSQDETLAGSYCALDSQAKRVMKKRAMGEMENEFLLALSSWCANLQACMI